MLAEGLNGLYPQREQNIDNWAPLNISLILRYDLSFQVVFKVIVLYFPANGCHQMSGTIA